MLGAIKVYEELGYAPLIFVHDSNIIEVHEDVAEKIADACFRLAGGVFLNDDVVFIPEVKIGRTWGDMSRPDDRDEDESVDSDDSLH